MARFALIFATQHGQTRKIAERIATEMRRAKDQIEIFGDLDAYPNEFVDYDAIILGGPVYVGQLPKNLIRWAKNHAGRLNAKPVAIFTVSLNAADARPNARKMDEQILDQFCTATGLRPKLRASLKGALLYREYGWFKRWIMRRISGSAGGPTDTSRDYEMTDWGEVLDFARACHDELVTKVQVKLEAEVSKADLA